MSASLVSIAFVGTYPPTACGIATFNQSLRDAMTGWTGHSSPEAFGYVVTGVIRLVDEPSGHLFGEVVAEWVRGDQESARRAAEVASRHDCVVLQHEFGIYGGDDGCEVLDFLDACSVPVVAVLHTLLPSPTARQRQIVEHITSVASVVVVQTEAACTMLLDTYDVDRDRVVVIPHGAASNLGGPVRSYSDGGTPTVLTWGLLGPGKGIEHGIRAVASLAERGGPVVSYVVVGSTHPRVVGLEGERYRDSLVALAHELGIEDQVVFDASYRDWQSLRQIIRGADVVLLPYDNRDQVTSGVLAEALASARAVVATAFPHALEVLNGGAGIVVPHEDPGAIADAIELILGDRELRRSMETAARVEAAPLLWPRVGQAYLEQVRLIVPTLVEA